MDVEGALLKSLADTQGRTEMVFCKPSARMNGREKKDFRWMRSFQDPKIRCRGRSKSLFDSLTLAIFDMNEDDAIQGM